MQLQNFIFKSKLRHKNLDILHSHRTSKMIYMNTVCNGEPHWQSSENVFLEKRVNALYEQRYVDT